MKEKYINKNVKIYAPNKGRLLFTGGVIDVINENVLHVYDEDSDFETAFYLSDGICVEIMED